MPLPLVPHSSARLWSGVSGVTRLPHTPNASGRPGTRETLAVYYALLCTYSLIPQLWALCGRGQGTKAKICILSFAHRFFGVRLIVTKITPRQGDKFMAGLLWGVVVVLVVLWLLGLLVHIGGGLIHILIVIALIVLIYNLIAGRRAL